MSWVHQLKDGYPKGWFVDVCETYHCSICLEVAREPVNLEACSHVFCRLCLERYWAAAPRQCPACRTQHQDAKCQVNGFVQSNIRQLTIKCPADCPWTGTLGTRDRNLNDHFDVCSHIVLKCTSGCGDMVMRKDMGQHITEACSCRLVTCSCCDQSMMWKELVAVEHAGMIETPELFAQPRLIPNDVVLCRMAGRCVWPGCNIIMEKGKLTQHMENDCPHRVVSCVVCTGEMSHSLPIAELPAHITSLPLESLADTLIKHLLKPAVVPTATEIWHREVLANTLQADFECDVQHTKKHWYQAVFKVVQGSQVLVHFWNLPKDNDEIVDFVVDASRFAPLGTHTKDRHTHQVIPPQIAAIPVRDKAKEMSGDELYVFRCNVSVGDKVLIRPTNMVPYQAIVVKLFRQDPEHGIRDAHLYRRGAAISKNVFFRHPESHALFHLSRHGGRIWPCP